MSPTQEVLFAQELIETTINGVLAHGIERLIIPTSQGNHGRTTHRTRISTGAYNSFEWLLYQTLKRRYADDKRVEFMISDGNMQYVKIYDTVVRFSHGDAIKYGGGIGGVTIPILKKVNAWNKARHAHETCIGHFHQRVTIAGVNVNGSLIGYAPFAQWIGAEPEPPEQGMFLVDSRRGKCHPKDLWCSERKEYAR